MNRREKIFGLLKNKKFASGRELSEILGISRQAVNKHLKELIQNGSVVKEGATKGAVYSLVSAETKIQPIRRFKKTYPLSGLEEHNVFQEFATLLNLRNKLSRSAWDIAYYAFTEILNNAIEHSESDHCHVNVSLDQYSFLFNVRDFGIGIFYSIFKKLDLSDENAALGELIKGKTTTMREKHAGEGVFFTSKSADVISFRSHKINLIFDNLKKDVFVEDRKRMKGTEVDFTIGRHSRRRLDRVFGEFAPEEFEYRFEKSTVLVKLFQEDCVSRSEAKRMLSGLDKFRVIMLDFKSVKSVGQGFADEIFRVFRSAHPDTTIKTQNLSPSLVPMIKHVVDNKKNIQLTIS